ncbi:MAG: hypothetical protein KC503_28700 [Myxococcales bacterium]|nr:hypothetical protein [Myxococcales bacterium]
MARRLALALLASLLGWAVLARPARAQVQGGGGLVETRTPPWRLQPKRWFFATRVDLGFVFLRPRISLGYGQPHARWLGIDINPIVSGEGLGAYGGLRFALPYLDLRVGGRWRFFTFRRSFLEQKDRYIREDIELRDGPKSRYAALEAELTGNFPIRKLSLLQFELAGSYVIGVPDGYNVYEEDIRVVLEPPWVWRARVGYAFRLLREDALTVGLLVEIVHNPGRDKFAIRGGVRMALRIRYDLDMRLAFIPVLVSKDSLGAAGGDVFLIGLRWRWATGQP